jgi:CRP/FNR family transcriptional regulator
MDTRSNCPHDQRVSCLDCSLKHVCLPITLEAGDIEKLDNIIARGKPLHKGNHIYRQHDSFSSIFAVRSGSVKSYSIDEEGEELVTGFYFPGEVLGTDGIGQNQHASSAVAMETSSVCQIPFHNLGELSQTIPSLQQNCFQIMSQEIVEDRRLMALLSKSHSDQRVATFLLTISARKSRNRLSGTLFRLPMSRGDMGNYLGLTVETISRVFSRLQKQQVVLVNNKDITILDMDGLRVAAGTKVEFS